MDQSAVVLLLTTFSVGILHTLLGPDHYLPFIALSGARGWSRRKTVGITAVCGIGHILSAVILGLIAASIGSLLNRLEFIETVRGHVAAWLLIGFGVAYAAHGIWAAIREREGSGHTHPAGERTSGWILFLIFLFGPCEPLIPLMMYPAVTNSRAMVLATVLVFGAATLIAMLSVVTLSVFGMKRITRYSFFQRWGNALAGAVICSCGLAINFLGL